MMNGAPLKPWQVQQVQGNTKDGCLMSVVQPDPPTNGITTSNEVQKMDNTPTNLPYAPPYPNNAQPFGYNSYGMGYSGMSPYGGGYGSFFGNPFTGNILPNENLLLPDSPFHSTEQRIRNLINTIGSLMRVVGGVFQMVDSTAYAAWSSVMAIVSVIEQLKLLRHEHLRTWVDVIKGAIRWILRVLHLKGGTDTPIADNASIQLHPAAFTKRASALPSNGMSPTKRFINDVVIPAAAVGLSYMVMKALMNVFQKPAFSKGRLAKAQFPFSAAGDEYLDFEEGDDLYIFGAEVEEGWAQARNKLGKAGLVPINYVKFVESHQ